MVRNTVPEDEGRYQCQVAESIIILFFLLSSCIAVLFLSSQLFLIFIFMFCPSVLRPNLKNLSRGLNLRRGSNIVGST